MYYALQDWCRQIKNRMISIASEKDLNSACYFTACNQMWLGPSIPKETETP